LRAWTKSGSKRWKDGSTAGRADVWDGTVPKSRWQRNKAEAGCAAQAREQTQTRAGGRLRARPYGASTEPSPCPGLFPPLPAGEQTGWVTGSIWSFQTPLIAPILRLPTNKTTIPVLSPCITITHCTDYLLPATVFVRKSYGREIMSLSFSQFMLFSNGALLSHSSIETHHRPILIAR